MHSGPLTCTPVTLGQAAVSVQPLYPNILGLAACLEPRDAEKKTAQSQRAVGSAHVNEDLTSPQDSDLKCMNFPGWSDNR